MRSLACLLLICLQVFVVHGGGGYGHEDLQRRCEAAFNPRLNREARYRLERLVARFGKPAFHALMLGFREMSSHRSISSANLETYLCNKVKKVVSGPKFLSYVRIDRNDYCERIQGEVAEIFNATEQKLAQNAAGGKKVIIGMLMHRGVFMWYGSNKPISYRNWASEQPSGYYKRCVYMDTNGKWKHYSCNIQYTLCEKRPIVCGPSGAKATRPPTRGPTTRPKTPTRTPTTTQSSLPTSGDTSALKMSTSRMPTRKPTTRAPPVLTSTTVSPGLPTSGDASALTDPAYDTKSLELSMDIDYTLVRTSSREFALSFYKAIQKVIAPKLITIRNMRSGSTIVTFTLTAPKDSDALSHMIKQLKRTYEQGHFKMTFKNREVSPTRGFKLQFSAEDHDDDFPRVYRILIYIFVIVAILVGFTLIVIVVKSLQKHRTKTKPEGQESPPIFWVNGIPTSDLHLDPPPEKDAPPAYSEACQEKA